MELIRCKNKEESLSLSAKEISKYFFETKEEILFLSSGEKLIGQLKWLRL
jgi:hypothetical protein